MKWKTAFTADEASMIAADIEWFYKLSPETQATVLDKPDGPLNEWLEREPLSPEEQAAVEDVKQKIEIKDVIHQALLDEIKLADNSSKMGEANYSPLKISVREQIGQDDVRIDAEQSKATGDSLAVWFWRFDREIAAKFDIEIEQKMEPQNRTQDHPLAQISKPVGTKTANSYLRLIYALAEALADGSLTEVKNKDAEIITNVLAAKGVACPVGEKTLAKYLSEGSEL